MPPLPDWSAAHPLVVHFPVALLLFAPILILMAVFFRRAWKPFAIAALLILLAGAAGAVAAVSSGEAGESAAEVNRAAYATLERHEELAELTRTIFLALGGLFALLVAVTTTVKARGRAIFVPAALVLLIPYAYGAFTLIRTAHEGGILVHHFGVRAPMPAPPSAASNAPADDHD